MQKLLPHRVRQEPAVAACRFGWDRYLGPAGRFIGMKGFGASAPGPAVMKFFGLTAENVVSTAKAALAGKK